MFVPWIMLSILLWLIVGFSAAMWYNHFVHEVEKVSPGWIDSYAGFGPTVLFTFCGHVSYFLVFCLIWSISEISKKIDKLFRFRLNGLKGF